MSYPGWDDYVIRGLGILFVTMMWVACAILFGTLTFDVMTSAPEITFHIDRVTLVIGWFVLIGVTPLLGFLSYHIDPNAIGSWLGGGHDE